METRWGKRLGRYEIVAELGRGTMGVVYKARDPKIDRFVAVKAISVLNQDSDEERQYRERFFYEAQAAGRLLHPGIVTIFDVGEDADTRSPYLVMEFVQGQSLKQLCGTTKTLPLQQALNLTEELAEALDHAHAQGVIHRDIKPANILITEEGHAKIADFGIAKMDLSHLTLPGHVIGTPAYMSPEQLAGERVDGRSDLFSLGVVLYSMVTGYNAFQGNSATTVCFKVVNREPLPATSFDPDLPHELDAVMSRAMAKEPAERYQRGMEFALDIRELREKCFPETKIERSGSTTITRASTARISRRGLRKFLDRAWVLHRLKEPSTRNWYIAAGIVALAGCMLMLIGKAPIKTPPTMVAVPAPAIPTVQNPIPTNNAASSSTASAAPVSQKATTAPVARRPKSAPSIHYADLAVQIRHHFTDATLSIYADDQLLYTHALHADSKKKLVVFHGIDGSETAQLQMPTGHHTLRVHIESGENSLDESKSVSATFAEGDAKSLGIEFDKHNREMRITLR